MASLSQWIKISYLPPVSHDFKTWETGGKNDISSILSVTPSSGEMSPKGIHVEIRRMSTWISRSNSICNVWFFFPGESAAVLFHPKNPSPPPMETPEPSVHEFPKISGPQNRWQLDTPKPHIWRILRAHQKFPWSTWDDSKASRIPRYKVAGWLVDFLGKKQSLANKKNKKG